MAIQEEFIQEEKMIASKVLNVGKNMVSYVFNHLPKFPEDFIKAQNQAANSTPKTGRQLHANKPKFEDIEINKENIKDFESVARKRRINYSLKKMTTPQPDGTVKEQYIVTFKAKDAKAMNAAMSEYMKKAMSRQEKPRLAEQLKRKIEQAMDRNKVQERTKTKSREATL